MRPLATVLLLLPLAAGCQPARDGVDSTSAGIRERLEAIQVAPAPKAPAVDPMAVKLAAVESRVSALEGSFNKTADNLGAKIDALGKQVGQSTAAFAEMKQTIAKAPAPAPAAKSAGPSVPPPAPAVGTGDATRKATADPGYTGLLMLSQPNKACRWCEVWNKIAADEGWHIALEQGPRNYRVVYLMNDDDFDRWDTQGTPVFLCLKNGQVRDRIDGFNGSMPAFRDIIRRLNVVLTAGN
jgi:hypothetical protein